MQISPNGHFIAVASEHIYIYTGPSTIHNRIQDLRSQGYPLQMIKDFSTLPPLSLVTVKRNIFVDLPCTGMAFDPSSRLVIAVSACRGIAFVPIYIKRSLIQQFLRYIINTITCRTSKNTYVSIRDTVNVFFNILLFIFLILLVRYYRLLTSFEETSEALL